MGVRHRNTTKKIRNTKHLQRKHARSWRSARDQGLELQEKSPKLTRVIIAVCGGKLQERVRSRAPYQETRGR